MYIPSNKEVTEYKNLAISIKELTEEKISKLLK